MWKEIQGERDTNNHQGNRCVNGETFLERHPPVKATLAETKRIADKLLNLALSNSFLSNCEQVKMAVCYPTAGN